MSDGKPIEVEALGTTPVVADSPIPLYYQVESDLRRLMDEGVLEPGCTLPPEMELVRSYGVSRHTIRMAMSRLAAENLITRRAGRGTIVRPEPDRMKFYLDRSFTRQMADMGRQAHSRVLKQAVDTVQPSDPSPLRPYVGNPCLRLLRLRFGGDEPIGFQQTVILTDQCPGLDAHDFAKESLYDVLSVTCRLAITEIRHTIGAAVADEQQAAWLEIEAGDPLLLVNTTALLEPTMIIEYTSSYYRADRYVYSTTHTYP